MNAASIFVLAAGGSLGAVARYCLGIVIKNMFPGSRIPIPILAVNVLGSLGLGVFLGYFFEAARVEAGNNLYLFLGTGFFGAFTTFSTFSLEAVLLLRRRWYKKVAVYVLGSVAGSLAAFMLGFFTAVLVGG